MRIGDMPHMQACRSSRQEGSYPAPSPCRNPVCATPNQAPLLSGARSERLPWQPASSLRLRTPTRMTDAYVLAFSGAAGLIARRACDVEALEGVTAGVRRAKARDRWQRRAAAAAAARGGTQQRRGRCRPRRTQGEGRQHAWRRH